MKYLRFLPITFLTLIFCSNTIAQVVFSKEHIPSIHGNSLGQIPLKTMPDLQYDKLLEEEAERQAESRIPAKFGFMHRVNLSLENSGNWNTLENGDRIWQLKIFAQDAMTINLNYGAYDLPKGGKLYVYNESMTDVLGPFTDENEKQNKEFATGFTRGDFCLVEYHEPSSQRGKGILQINGVVHGYRSIANLVSDAFRDFQDAGQCNYDVGCSIGNGWEDQIKSVGLIMAENNTSFCTGTLINTTANNCEPYFLTADHCFPNDNAGDLLNNIVLFNFHSPTPVCPGISTNPGNIDQTVQGCSVVSKSEETDFCLLRLTVNPINFYDVYYSGWDRTNTPASGAVGIHHGSGDVKKISIEEDPVVSSDDDRYWLITNWDFGTTEAGASGSSVFDINNKRIIGQLCCGNAACDGNSNNGGEEDYGKIYYSWDQISSNSAEQLKPWLDPINSGAMTMDGNSCLTAPVAAFSPAEGSDLNLCGPGVVRFSDQSLDIPTSWSWTFSGAGVSPATSTLANPEITLNSEGTLNATLMVSNAQGSNTISQSYNVSFFDCEENSFCETANLIIPDNAPNGITHSISLPNGSTLIDLDIEVDLNHEFVGDLIVQLEHEGTTVNLVSRPNAPIRGCQENNIQARFDDQASQEAQVMCETSNPAIGGNVIPLSPLSVFNNIDPGGIWTIRIADQGEEDTGLFNSWCIRATTGEMALSNEGVFSESNSITAFPNPIAAGSEIHFTNPNTIGSVRLFNVLGEYTDIRDSIIPNHLSKGVYILEITLKSGKKEVSKLIIR